MAALASKLCPEVCTSSQESQYATCRRRNTAETTVTYSHKQTHNFELTGGHQAPAEELAQSIQELPMGPGKSGDASAAGLPRPQASHVYAVHRIRACLCIKRTIWTLATLQAACATDKPALLHLRHAACCFPSGIRAAFVLTCRWSTSWACLQFISMRSYCLWQSVTGWDSSRLLSRSLEQVADQLGFDPTLRTVFATCSCPHRFHWPETLAREKYNGLHIHLFFTSSLP